ncbi:hypothetical protein BV22DRAFT_938686 [Leucogyrophana mollusca]|uniref:Uncharacterized protein n=1 Tax=Leucogyrophana mollusca TaxID=85980 RepID=A0ACB8AV01_9AGAM|nr:hypothetical protein BV22DRAFT_938686 [Leucogyrophana mollusca]
MAHELSLYPLGRTGGSYFQVISSWRTGLGSKTGVRVNFGRMWRKSGRTDVPKFGGFGYMLIGNMRGSSPYSFGSLDPGILPTFGFVNLACVYSVKTSSAAGISSCDLVLRDALVDRKMAPVNDMPSASYVFVRGSRTAAKKTANELEL